jgi:hypothetical protein
MPIDPICETADGCYMFAPGTPERTRCERKCRLLHATRGRDVDLMGAAVAHLELLRQRIEEESERKLSFFAESGVLYLIDDERDDELSKGNSLLRARPFDEGGSIVANLGGTKFSGGGW